MSFVNIYGAEASIGVDDGELDVIDEDCLPLLQALMPHGAAWSRDPDTELTALLRALSYEYCRIKRRGRDLLNEIDPDTTYELLEDWERNYGLPTDCVQPTTLSGRRAALHALMTGYSDPTKANLIALALAIGYDISIVEHSQADLFTCDSGCDEALYSDQWVFVWDVLYNPGANDDVLQCSLEAVSPLHTLVRFYPSLEWASKTSGTTKRLYGVAHSTAIGLWVAVGEAIAFSVPTIKSSPDGTTWTSRTSTAPVGNDFLAIASKPGASLFVAVGTGGVVNTSTNGTTWTNRNSTVFADLYGVAWNSTIGLWAAVGDSGVIVTSPDGTTWTERTGSGDLKAVAAGGPYFVAVGDSGKVLTSTNGILWTARTGSTIASITANMRGVSYGVGFFTAVGEDGVVINASNPTSLWTLEPSAATTDTLSGVNVSSLGTDAPGLWLVVGGTPGFGGGTGRIEYSRDGTNYLDNETSLPKTLRAVGRKEDATAWVAVGDTGTILLASY